MRADRPAHIYTEIEGEAITSQFIFFRTPDSKFPYGMSRHNIRYIPTVKNSYEVKAGIDILLLLYQRNIISISSKKTRCYTKTS